MAGSERRPDTTGAHYSTTSTAQLTPGSDGSGSTPYPSGTAIALSFFVVLALALIAVIVRGWWHSRKARIIAANAGLPAGQLHSVDPIRSRAELKPYLQQDLHSSRYGLSGRPDRIMRIGGGALAPVDVKNRETSRGGQPYPSHMAQVLAYCLLVEELYGCHVPYGVIDYRDRLVRVPFDRTSREWILGLISTVQQFKSNGFVPRRDHDHAQRCRGCGYRLSCAEALRGQQTSSETNDACFQIPGGGGP